MFAFVLALRWALLVVSALKEAGKVVAFALAAVAVCGDPLARWARPELSERVSRTSGAIEGKLLPVELLQTSCRLPCERVWISIILVSPDRQYRGDILPSPCES